MGINKIFRKWQACLLIASFLWEWGIPSGNKRFPDCQYFITFCNLDTRLIYDKEKLLIITLQYLVPLKVIWEEII